jgi:hypothetical protein
MRWGWLVLFGVCGCPSSNSRNATVRVDADSCVPGMSIGCSCPGGVKGVQRCASSGRAYGPCEGCDEMSEAPAPAASASKDEDDPCRFAAPFVATPPPPPPPPPATVPPPPPVLPPPRPAGTVAPIASAKPWASPSYPRHGYVPHASHTATALEPPVPPMPCAGSDLCEQSGACTSTSFGCRVTSHADCRQGEACRKLGLCTYAAVRPHQSWGTCHACRESDCRSADTCRVFGRCTAKKGDCVATEDEDCAKSEGCRLHGLCDAVEGTCIAGVARHCKASLACKKHGYCRVAAGTCAK